MRSFRSLPVRIRLTAWYVGVLAGVLLFFLAGTSLILYFQLARQQTRFAIQDIETVEGLLFFAPDGKLQLNESYHLHPDSRKIPERLLEVVTPDGTVLYKNERLGANRLGGKPFAGEGVDGFSERSSAISSGDQVVLVSRQYVLNKQPMVIRLAFSKKTIWSRVDDFVTASFTAFLLLLLLVGFLAYQLARRTLRPLEQMANRAEQITADRLDQRLPVSNPDDELGHLARVFNTVLDRLQQSFDQLRRFTSDASHELRTPLAAMRSVGEVGLQKNRTPDEYQDAIGSMLEEVNRLTKLIENLLTISRADANQIDLNISTYSLPQLVREVAGIVEILAEERAQTLTISGETELTILGDRLLLRHALMNILHNAVKYSPQSGEISVAITRGPLETATVIISDDGPGIAPEHRTKIFDRFYRVDAARARDTGGAGLGLSIASWAVQAQGGQIHVQDSGPGSTFVIELPLRVSMGMQIS